jgi:hypothetical protein
MKGFLRLVGNSGERPAPPQSAAGNPEFDGQLRLKFDDEPVRRIVLVAMDEIDGWQLHELVIALKPFAAVDLRHAVRFDLPGTNRARFFDDLSQLHALYIREPIEWHHIEKNPMVTTSDILPLRVRYEVLEQETGHILLMVPRYSHSRVMASALNLALSTRKSHGWRIEQAL